MKTNDQNLEGKKQSGNKIPWKEQWVFYVITTAIVIFLGLIVGQFTIGFLLSAILQLVSGFYPSLEDAVIEVVVKNISFSMVLVLLFLYIRMRKGSLVPSELFQKQNFKGKWLMAGVAIGGLLCIGSVLVAVSFGGLTFSFHSFDLVVLGVAMISSLVQATTEEILFRGYLLNGLRRNYSLGVSIVICGLAFSFMHVVNPKITVIAVVNITLMGIILSYLAAKRKSLDLVIGIHFMWNFMEEMICGTPNSGIVFPRSVFALTGGESTLFYNQNFGIEAAVQTLLLWGLLFVIAIRVEMRRRGKVGFGKR